MQSLFSVRWNQLKGVGIKPGHRVEWLGHVFDVIRVRRLPDTSADFTGLGGRSHVFENAALIVLLTGTNPIDAMWLEDLDSGRVAVGPHPRLQASPIEPHGF